MSEMRKEAKEEGTVIRDIRFNSSRANGHNSKAGEAKKKKQRMRG